MRVYISGPISGLTQEQYTRNFERAALWCVKNDHEPVNPIQVPACEAEDCWDLYGKGETLPTPGGGGPVKEDGTTFLHHYRCYMKYDIIALLDCDAILMLPGSHNSKGATCEKNIAITMGLKVGHFVAEKDRMSGSWYQ